MNIPGGSASHGGIRGVAVDSADDVFCVAMDAVAGVLSSPSIGEQTVSTKPIRGRCVSVLTHAESELLHDTGLSQHRIRGVPRQNLLVYWKAPLSHRAVPDFMVSPARLLKVTFWRVTGHQEASTSLSSCWYRTWNLAVRSAGTPFSSSNSGMRVFSFCARTLGESASATSPGTSSLSATQTPASLSHRARISKTSCEVGSCTNDRSLARLGKPHLAQAFAEASPDGPSCQRHRHFRPTNHPQPRCFRPKTGRRRNPALPRPRQFGPQLSPYPSDTPDNPRRSRVGIAGGATGAYCRNWLHDGPGPRTLAERELELIP